MRGMPQQPGGQNSAFLGSVKGLANMLAVIAAFMGTPAAYGASVGWVVRYSEQNYMTGIGDFISLIWFVCVALTIFFIARMTLSTAVVMGGIAVAARFAI